MKRIGILSDTHGLFDDTLRDFFSEVDEIWHAGDIGTPQVADDIAAFKPLRAVYGNIDGAELRRMFPRTDIWTTEGVKVAMTHIGGYPGRYEPETLRMLRTERPALFIDGHSHILRVRYDKPNELLFINPGAAGKYGFHTVRTAIRLKFDSGNMSDLEVGEWSRNDPRNRAIP